MPRDSSASSERGPERKRPGGVDDDEAEAADKAADDREGDELEDEPGPRARARSGHHPEGCLCSLFLILAA